MTSAPAWFRQGNGFFGGRWKHGWTTTQGPDFQGDPAAPEHGVPVDKLVDAAELEKAAWVHQVHGGKILKAEGSGCVGEADGLWTDQPGLGVIGRGADCPLILVGGTRPDNTAVWGFAHASWRSTVEAITTGLVFALTEAGAHPDGMQAVICPSAGPCCYQVGEEVRQKALESLGPDSAWFFTQRTGGMTFDLWAANTAQLTAGGVPEKNIHNQNHCTICGGDLYPSFRRQGQAAGRFAAIIGA
jgi:YfiH family protein